MVNLSRRSFFTGLVAAVSAPAVIRTPGLLMPVKSLIVPQGGEAVALTGEVPLGLPAGSYELQIVNSELAVGGRILALTFKILDGPHKEELLSFKRRLASNEALLAT